MTSGEVMDTSVRAYQQLGWPILKLTALPAVMCTASVFFVVEFVLPGFFTASSTQMSSQVVEAAGALALTLLIGLPLFLLGLSYSNAIVTSLISDFMVGNVPDFNKALDIGRRLLGKLVALNFRMLLIASSGFLAALVLLMLSAFLDTAMGAYSGTPALVSGTGVLAFIIGLCVFPAVLALYALAVPILVLESKPIGESVKRSRTLLKKSGYQVSGHNTVFNALAVMFLVVLVVFGGARLMLLEFGLRDIISDALIDTSLHELVMSSIDLLPLFTMVWLVVPIWCATTTILYYERRTRLEGYDIEVLAQDVWRTDKQARFEL